MYCRPSLVAYINPLGYLGFIIYNQNIAQCRHSRDVITLHACARGKVIGQVVVVIVIVNNNIVKLGDLGT